MKAITSTLNFHFNSVIFTDLSEIERNNLIYSSSVILKDVVNYRDLLIQITFLETTNIPDTIQVYCFKSKTPLEKEKIESNKPAGYFSFPKHNFLSPYQKQKSNQLLIDLRSDFDGRKFRIEEPYLIDRFVFFIDTDNVDLSFNYQLFMRE